jgi:hypothetical protein
MDITMDGPSKISLMETFVVFFIFSLHNEYNFYFILLVIFVLKEVFNNETTCFNGEFQLSFKMFISA